MADRQQPEQSISSRPSRGIEVAAWLGLAWERLWPLTVPLFLVIIAFLTLSWLGFWNLLPDWLRIAGVGLFGVGGLAALYPLRLYRQPTQAEVFYRIEDASRLDHRPVSVQTDAPAGSQDKFSEILWREHQARMAARMKDLSAGTARPDGNRLDRFALRAMLPIIAFAALGFSYGSHGGKVLDAFVRPIDRSAMLSRLDVWVTPPSYTGLPPLYLKEKQISSASRQGGSSAMLQPAIQVPEGSELAIRYVNSNKNATIPSARLIGALNENIEAGATENGGAILFEAKLSASARLEVMAEDELLAAWDIAVTADRAPIIELDEMPSTAQSGALQLSYSMSDDYGVVSARALISRPLQRSDARPLIGPPELSLPLPRARTKKGSTKTNKDLSNHPWAGSEVELVLEARDDLGQIGLSKPVRFRLPGRNFQHPFAKALVEQRRILTLNANDAPLVVNMLDAVIAHPATHGIGYGPYIALQSAYRMVVDNRSDDHLRNAADMLWETALAVEFGDMSDAERRLREAQEKLSEALENDASDEEIEKLMEELRQAMSEFLEQMAREMERNRTRNNPLANLDNSQMLTQQDIDRMMQRIEDLAKSGSRDAARQLLNEMQRMMDNLMAGRHQEQRQTEGNQLNQALDKLSELMQKQQELMNETFSMQRQRPQMNQQGQPQGEQNQQQRGQSQQGNQGQEGNQPMSPEEFAETLEQLEKRQEALQQQLGELGQQLEDLGLDPSEQFGEAGEEMAEAGENLGQGEPGAAAGDQGQALDALRRGAQQIMQQMAGDRNQGGQQSGQAGQSVQPDSGTDPLGRRREGDKGQFGDGNTRVPGEIDAQRAREIMEAIRKRLSNPLRPLIERDYLERLLQSR